MIKTAQTVLFCLACGNSPAAGGRCPPCYRRWRHSLRYFGGHREVVLARDGYRCQGCGAPHQRAVHHRRPGLHSPACLVTICPACHAIIHRLGANHHWLPRPLLELWREQHPFVPLQMQMEIQTTVPVRRELAA